MTSIERLKVFIKEIDKLIEQSNNEDLVDKGFIKLYPSDTNEMAKVICNYLRKSSTNYLSCGSCSADVHPCGFSTDIAKALYDVGYRRLIWHKVVDEIIGSVTTIIISSATELHHLDNEIKELEVKLIQNRKEQEDIDKHIKELEEELEGEDL